MQRGPVTAGPKLRSVDSMMVMMMKSRALLVVACMYWLYTGAAGCREVIRNVTQSEQVTERCGPHDLRRCIRYRPIIKPIKQYVDCIPECNGQWTQFFDRDNPSVTGDWETLDSLQAAYPGQICDNPSAIYAETTDGVPAELTGETFAAYDVQTGFVCVKNQQPDGVCLDYRVKFCCRDCDGMMTQFFDRDDPSGFADAETLQHLRPENPGKICEKPTAIYAETLAGVPAESTGEIFSPYNPVSGFGCHNSHQPDGRCMDYRVRFCCPAKSCTHWTPWYDRDNPSGTGDWETLSDLREQYPNQICRDPTGLQVRVKLTGQIVSPSDGNFYRFDTQSGFVCRLVDQSCKDYEVRFCCPRFTSGVLSEADYHKV